MRKLALGCLVIVAVGAVVFQQMRIVRLEKAVASRNVMPAPDQDHASDRIVPQVPVVASVSNVAPVAVTESSKETVTRGAVPEHKLVAESADGHMAAPAAAKGGAAKPGMGDFMKSISSMMTNSAMKEMIRHQAKVVLEMQYGRLFKLLDLSPEKAESLKAILLDRQMAMMESGMAMFNGSPEDRKAAGDVVKVRKEAYDKQVADLLGAEDNEAFTQYEATQAERMQVEMFKSSLAASKEPLTERQEYDLVLAMHQARTNSPALAWMSKQDAPPDSAMFRGAGVTNMLAQMDVLRQQYAAVASSILTPVQAESFKTYLEGQKAMNEMQIKIAAQMFGGEDDADDEAVAGDDGDASVDAADAVESLR